MSRNHSIGIALDVYGTMVDPYRMADHLQPFAGERAERFAELWREKQLEYSWRRALMNAYEPFSTCTRQALGFTAAALGIDLSPRVEEQLMKLYGGLPAFPDTAGALAKLRELGATLAAFSNGQETSVRDLLGRAGLLSALDAVISADTIKSFKPAPSVYRHLIDELGMPLDRIWLVSGNPFDVIGAKACGLAAAWIKRKPDATFDPWGIEPDLIATDLLDFANLLAPSS